MRELLSTEFAQNICQLVSEETGYRLIFVDKQGKIFAAFDRERVGNFHAVGKKVMDGVINEGVVSIEEAAALQEKMGAKAPRAGISMPVVYKGKRLASLGVGGDPEAIRPVLGLTRRTITLYLENKELLDQLTTTISTVNHRLQSMLIKTDEVVDGARQVEQLSYATKNTTDTSVRKIKSVEDTIGILRQVSLQSKILSLNASVEAVRAGQAGLGFAVVAREIGKLANESERSIVEVSSIIKNTQDVFDTIRAQVNENNNILQKQTASMHELKKLIDEVREAMGELNLSN